MSCSITPPGPMQNNPGDDSDYGFDFTPDEEALLEDLLSKAATRYATASASATATATPAVTLTTATEATKQQQQQEQLQTDSQAAVPGSGFACDIEECDIASSSGYNGGNADNNKNESPLSPSRAPKVLGREKKNPPFSWMLTQRVGWYGAIQVSGNDNAFVEHPDSTEGRDIERKRQDLEREQEREQEWAAFTNQSTVTDPSTVRDTRSPLDRFRAPPKKAFSVSDLVTPAWCELQYWYTLVKFGRKKRTPAMKLGSSIHRTFEDELYTTVPVEVTTKEDAWALRIWNVIQGLRMLRDFGITREMEVWGVVDGQVVNGVIDQLSYECPDPELEATAADYYASVEAERNAVPEYQMSLSDYLLSPAGGGRKLSDFSMESSTLHERENEHGLEESPDENQKRPVDNIPRVYLTDIKTRGTRSVPTVKSSSFRPTSLQLQLYYHMLNRLITSDDVTMEVLASRYRLNPHRPFTDAFVSEVGGLNDQFFDASSSSQFDPDYVPTPDDAHGIFQRNSPSSSSSSLDSTSLLLEHNNLADLWQFMKQQLRLTFLTSSPSPSSPQPDVNENEPLSPSPSIPAESQPQTLKSYPTTLSPILTAKFVSSAPPASTSSPDASPSRTSKSRVLGSRSFLFDPATLTSHLSDQMEWWRGYRRPRGVEIMDAWKCRICEFNEECEWRREKEWAAANRNRRSGGKTSTY